MDKANGRYIYFIQREDTQAIKIGMSYAPVDRLRYLQYVDYQGIPLKPLGVLQEKYSSDKYIHRRFKDYHIEGEWFLPAPELLRFIRDNSVLGEFNLDKLSRINRKRVFQDPPLTIYQVRKKLTRNRSIFDERCLPGIYRLNDPNLVSKNYRHHYYIIIDEAEFQGQSWVFVCPVCKNGNTPSIENIGRLINWFPLDALEWVAFHINPSKTNHEHRPQKRLTIEEAEKALHLLNEGTTQVELAAQLGVSQSYISAIKLGKIKRYRHLL